MKNILLIVPRLNIGGAETYTALVAENLQQRGYKVYTASGGGMLADRLSQKGIPNFYLPIRFSTSLSAFLLKRIIKKYKIDLIHANSAAAGITALKVKKYCKDIPVQGFIYGFKRFSGRKYHCTGILFPGMEIQVYPVGFGKLFRKSCPGLSGVGNGSCSQSGRICRDYGDSAGSMPSDKPDFSCKDAGCKVSYSSSL